ncbi:MAG: phosphatidate cytidylyltransferase [Micavibrio aeruginosavorus]|uniref:Phosphatidate cytidylyltransferase n=1 Tax=Micavibrio aeruginosavorus TaxID=349221 RepID=A0A7T5R1M2_9BACT|nr:MAG: phosphatidate cytidylyltransferase [Micavibrio aeruginosavorus]
MGDNIWQNPVVWGLGGIYGLLVVAALVVCGLCKSYPERNYSELIDRTRTWAVIITMVAIVTVMGTGAAVLFFGFISFLAFKEFLSIIPTRQSDRRVLFFAYLVIPIQYWFVYDVWYGMFSIFIPVYAFVVLAFLHLLTGETKGFIKAAGTLQWGLALTVYNLSHIAYLLVLPLKDPVVAGGAGLMLFMLFLTQFNDVAQYVWGKMAGRRRIIPSVSPNKTWEGFIGGVITTTLMAGFLASYLTPFSMIHGFVAGAVIAILGFIGDITVSAVKRDLGIKDSGKSLPGHGGYLDRLDSLTLVAPVFLHFTRYFYG